MKEISREEEEVEEVEEEEETKNHSLAKEAAVHVSLQCVSYFDSKYKIHSSVYFCCQHRLSIRSLSDTHAVWPHPYEIHQEEIKKMIRVFRQNLPQSSQFFQKLSFPSLIEVQKVGLGEIQP